MHPDQHADLAAAHALRSRHPEPDDLADCGHRIQPALTITLHGETWCTAACWEADEVAP